MKDFIRKVPTSSIVLVILTVFFVLWGVYQHSLAKGAEIFDNAVQLSKCEYSSENEGKFVCMNGRPELVKKSADPATGVEADGFVLIRNVEMYQYIIESDKVIKDFSSAQKENITGDGGEKYENPAFPEELQNAVFIGEAKLGEFEISPKFLVTMAEENPFMTKEYEYKEIDNLPDLKGKMNLKVSDGYYTDGDPENPQIGDIRVSYSYLPVSEIDSLTLFGVQQNGAVGTESAEDNSFMSDTLKNKNEISDFLFKEYKDAADGMFIIAGGLIIAAVIVYYCRNKKSRSEVH